MLRISAAGMYDRLTLNTAAITTGQNGYTSTVFSTKLISQLQMETYCLLFFSFNIFFSLNVHPKNLELFLERETAAFYQLQISGYPRNKLLKVTPALIVE